MNDDLTKWGSHFETRTVDSYSCSYFILLVQGWNSSVFSSLAEDGYKLLRCKCLKIRMFLAFFMFSICPRWYRNARYLDRNTSSSDIRKHDSHIFTFIIEKDSGILLIHHLINDVIYYKFFLKSTIINSSNQFYLTNFWEMSRKNSIHHKTWKN